MFGTFLFVSFSLVTFLFCDFCVLDFFGWDFFVLDFCVRDLFACIPMQKDPTCSELLCLKLFCL